MLWREFLISWIYVDSENTNYQSIDGILFELDKNKKATIMVVYPAGNRNEVYFIPSFVTTLRRQTFRCVKYLKTVVIPESITSQETEVFSYAEQTLSLLFTSSSPKCTDNMLMSTENYYVKTNVTYTTAICGYPVTNTLSIFKNLIGTTVNFIYDSMETAIYVYGTGKMIDVLNFHRKNYKPYYLQKRYLNFH